MNLRLPILLSGTLLAASLTTAAAQNERPTLSSEELFSHPRRAARRFDDFVYTAAERRQEAREKVDRLRRAMAARKLEAVVIATERNLNWLTAGGKDNVVWVQRETPVKLLVTPTKLYLVANNIEGPRMMDEELAGLGYEWVRFNWYGSEAEALTPLVRGKRTAFDDPGAAAGYKLTPAATVFDFQPVYYPITQGEVKKYRWLGRKVSEVMEQVAKVVRPGMTEYDVQHLLARELWYWDIVPTVLLTAVDERFRTYRHPVVVGAPLKNYVALNICARRWGQTVSTTRLVHFGPPDAPLARAWRDGPRVAAAMLAASKPGNTLGDVIGAAQRAYREIGFPDEWKLHHQGGMILGLERLYLSTPGDRTKIIPGMVLAWNPTVQGSKFEDTVMVKADGTLENFTAAVDWPTTEASAGGRTFRIPGLMIRPTE